MNLSQSGKYNLTTSNSKNLNFEVTNLTPPLEIKGSWNVSFINGMGAPSKTTFDELLSWSNRQEQGIKYYSGAAVYSKDVFYFKGNVREKQKVKT